MKLEKDSNPHTIHEAVEILRAGGVILFPTDTQYGLGADALSDDAVEKIYAIKGRDERKPIHCIVSDVAMMEKYAEVPDMARMLAGEFLPGGLTLILKKREGIETGIAHGISTIGIRIPNNQFCMKLAKEFGRPFTATSANVSGQKTEHTVEAILEQFGPNNSYSNVLKNIRIRKEEMPIDLVVDAGELPDSQPSTVVDLSGKEPVILREGAIPAADIWNLLGTEFQD
ncbi:MAG: L-threonylcarbamoyladenylate synthase [bacterium]|nr:L-threonylcarbamoyladenylate synthase [bacterium]